MYTNGCSGVGENEKVERKCGVTANKYRVSFWGDENIMQLDANDWTTPGTY